MRLVDGLARRAKFAPPQSAQQQVRRRTVRVCLAQESRRCHHPGHRVVAIHWFGREASAAPSRSGPRHRHRGRCFRLHRRLFYFFDLRRRRIHRSVRFLFPLPLQQAVYRLPHFFQCRAQRSKAG